MPIPMNKLAPGEKGRVLSLAVEDNALRQRLLDLGIVPGTAIERLMDSPIGDPICFRVRGAMIALRGEDASRIMVETGTADR